MSPLHEGASVEVSDYSCEWVNHTLKLARVDELRVRMGKLNLERFESCYSADAVARQLAAILRQAAKLA